MVELWAGRFSYLLAALVVLLVGNHLFWRKLVPRLWSLGQRYSLRIAEAWRNLVSCGGKPLAATHNLNFGNPEKPEIMGQFVGAIKGIGEACRALDFPVVSGNVSLYNETNGQGILPTPAIGGVGLVDDVTVHASLAFRREGEAIILIGATQGWLGQSIYLRDVCGREEGAPPPVDLAAEKRNGDFAAALKNYRRAAELFKGRSEPRGEALTLLSLANLYYLTGQTAKAEAQHAAAMKHIRRHNLHTHLETFT